VKRLISGRDWSREWRLASLAGATAGLALTPLAPPDPSHPALGAAPIAVMTLAVLRPREDTRQWPALAWLGVVA
jgi:hypothetical protein